MKAVILTFSKVYNKGANLQAYSLMTILRSKGLDVEFLDIQLPENYNIKGTLFSFVNNFFARRFRRGVNMRFTRKYTSVKELQKNPPVADIYIVGSDQVWNTQLTSRLDPRVYFFSFLPSNAKRIAYGASFGGKEWTRCQYDEEIKKLAGLFHSISVREEEGLRICSEVLGRKDAMLVLDPTLLINKKQLKELAPTNKHKHQAYCYFLYRNEQTDLLADRVRTLFRLPSDNESYFRKKMKMVCSIKRWLRNIQEAELVITNSFHCMVFAILYQKEFVVLPPYPNREERMLSLLRILNLEYRYITSMDALEQTDAKLSSKIDYKKVFSLLNQYRKSSFEFLDNSTI